MYLNKGFLSQHTAHRQQLPGDALHCFFVVFCDRVGLNVGRSDEDVILENFELAVHLDYALQARRNFLTLTQHLHDSLSYGGAESDVDRTVLVIV